MHGASSSIASLLGLVFLTALLAAVPAPVGGLAGVPGACDLSPPEPGSVVSLAMNIYHYDPLTDTTADCANGLSARLGGPGLLDSREPLLVPELEDVAGAAYHFAPAGSSGVRYLAIPHSDLYKTPRFTWTAWINADTFTSPPVNNAQVVTIQNGFGGAGTVAFETVKAPGCAGNDCAGALQFNIVCFSGNNLVRSAFRLEPGTWYHVAGSYDRASVRVYIDGTLAGQAPAANCHSWIGGPVYVGARGNLGDAGFRGLIDDVVLFGDVLTDEALEGLATAGRPWT